MSELGMLKPELEMVKVEMLDPDMLKAMKEPEILQILELEMLELPPLPVEVTARQLVVISLMFLLLEPELEMLELEKLEPQLLEPEMLELFLLRTENLLYLDTEITFPESVIYTVIFLVNSIIGVGIAYIQYRFMIIQSEPSEKRFIICQKILFIAGWIVCIGTAVNAVYSVKTHPTPHRIGAGLAFFLLASYNLFQSVYLYKRSFSSRCMCHFRLAAALIFYMAGMIGEWTGFVGLVMHQLTNYTDFQSLSLKFSREGVTICLRERTRPPNIPCKIEAKDLGLEEHKDT
ncbi:DNA damage-regulated autophagy modulator protein 1-like [Anomaloglossus baeobatrachus]|uniref:DNA damage-regulated autophagy modulator protein 1-like n=1 Tax=Anomaloglossus baeobatrachus TaxID=238106 RepID=UPI003F4F63B4